MRNEIVGVGASEHEHLQRSISLGVLNERDEIANELGPQKVHRRGRNVREQNGPLRANPKCLEIQWHGDLHSELRSLRRAIPVRSQEWSERLQQLLWCLFGNPVSALGNDLGLHVV